MTKELAVPKLTAQGATRVRLIERISGDSPGLFTVESLWDSLNTAINGLDALYADPEVLAALEANPVEPVSRVIGIVHARVGDTGAFVGQTMFSVTKPDPARIAAAAELALEIGGPLGVKGYMAATVFSGGAATGMMAAAAEIDDVDVWPNVSAAGAQDPRLQDFFAAVGASIVDRVLFKVH